MASCTSSSASPSCPRPPARRAATAASISRYRYEIQILDSFGLDEMDNGCGAIYGIKAPDQNMCYPPFTWQTYEIDFAEPKYEDGKKVDGSEATVTVKQNGVRIHSRARFRKSPPARSSPPVPSPAHSTCKITAIRSDSRTFGSSQRLRPNRWRRNRRDR